MSDYSNIPDFDSLPPVKGMPQGCAWGIFDKGGKKDKFGTINLITPEVVKAAVSEVKEGVSVSLKYGSPHQLRWEGKLGLTQAKLANWRDQDTGLWSQGSRPQGHQLPRHTAGAPWLR